MIDSLRIVAEGNSTEALHAIRDSIATITPYIQEMASNSRPEPYTIQNLSLASWNLLVAIFAAIFGLLGAVFGYLGYKYSKNTAKNVARISKDTQIALYFDFAKELYRNITAIVNLLKTHQEGNQILLNKIIALRISDFDDIFHIEDYNQNKDIYLEMKYIKDRMRSYNVTVDSNYRLAEQCKLSYNDLSNLLFRSIQILSLTKRAVSVLDRSYVDDKDLVLYLFGRLHVRHIINNSVYVLNEWKEKSFEVNIAELKDCYEKNLKAKEKLDSMIDDRKYHNPAINNIEYMQIVATCPDKEYNQLVQKEYWSKNDIKVLLAKIISYDSFIQAR